MIDKPRIKAPTQSEAQLHKTPVDLRSAHQIRISDAIKMIWKRRKREHPERDLQIAVAAYLAVALKPPTIWTAFPAGGGGKVRGGQLKAMGLKPGWPDILVIAPGPVVVAIELKAKVGRQSPEQKIVAKAFWDCKAPYYLCRSAGDVQMSLEDCRVPLHAKVTT